MTKEIIVKCNFASVFAKYSTVDELKAVANNICAQVKEAYDVRLAEIKSGNGAVVEVEVITSTEGAKAEAKSKAKAKTTGAKKTAEKVKSQEQKAGKQSKNEEALIAITDTEAIKKLGLKFEPYNEKCWVLRGNTKPLRKVLKEEWGLIFNSYLTGGGGWLFRNAEVQKYANKLGLTIQVA